MLSSLPTRKRLPSILEKVQAATWQLYNEYVIILPLMSAYNTLYDEAAENYGLITTEMAERNGVSGMSLVMLERRGRLQRVGRGVYRLEQHPATEYDSYATLVAKAGKGAFLWGPTVLALEKLCPTDPATLYVAVPGRIRRQLGRGVIVKNGADNASIKPLHGIPAQPIEEAIRASRGSIMDERLIEAANRAKEQGMLLSDKHEQLMKELNHAC